MIIAACRMTSDEYAATQVLLYRVTRKQAPAEMFTGHCCEYYSRVCQLITQCSAHSQARNPSILQPHTEGSHGLAHLINKPGCIRTARAQQPVHSMQHTKLY